MRSLSSGVQRQVGICRATPKIVSCENRPGIGIEQLMCSGMRDFVQRKWTDGPIYRDTSSEAKQREKSAAPKTTTISNIAISHVTINWLHCNVRL